MKKIIPNMGLYGRATEGDLPALAHIESIAERRSELGWHIKPHRHDRLYQLLCLYEGELEIWVDDRYHMLEGSWLVAVPLGSVHSFLMRPHSEGVVLSITDQLLTDDAIYGNSENFDALINHPQVVELTGAPASLIQLKRYFDAIGDALNQPAETTRESVMLLFQLVLIAFNQQLGRDTGARVGRQLDERRLRQFRSLVDRNFRNHWTLEQYAAELNVSVSTLKRLCQETLNTNPKAILQARLINEAKRRLIYTQQPLDELAYTLGFKDPAYFSRSFKRALGISPSVYRERNSFTHL